MIWLVRKCKLLNNLKCEGDGEVALLLEEDEEAEVPVAKSFLIFTEINLYSSS